MILILIYALSIFISYKLIIYARENDKSVMVSIIFGLLSFFGSLGDYALIERIISCLLIIGLLMLTFKILNRMDFLNNILYFIVFIIAYVIIAALILFIITGIAILFGA